MEYRTPQPECANQPTVQDISLGGIRQWQCVTWSLVCLASGAAAPGGLLAQGMVASEKRDRPPIPLPEGVTAPLVEFLDIASEAGLARPTGPAAPRQMTMLTETTGTGVALIDFDSDGLPDIFLVGTGRSASDTKGQPHRLFRNEGNLSFRDVSAVAGLGSTGWGQGVCAGDFDSDGHVDLFVTHWGPDALFRNISGSGFRNEAAERGLAGGADRWSTGCSFLDYDRDGDLDLFVAHYVDFDPTATPQPGEASQCRWRGAPIPCGPRGLAAEAMSLFANDGHGRFSDVTEDAGIATDSRFHGLGVLSADLDADGWTDIFVACDSTANLLFRNSGDGTFEEIGLASAAAYDEDGNEQAGMGVAAADYDGDSRTDLFVTNFASDTNTIYRNLGDGVFRDSTVPAGLATVTKHVGWGAEFLDFDQDGWPDIFAVNGHVAPSVDGAGIDETFAQPRLLFWNRGDGVFHSLASLAGPGIEAKHPSRGSAIGDLDNDGDLEIVVVNIREDPSLLQNQVTPTGNWLVVRAVAKSGSDAVGASVTVISGNRKQVREVRSGGGYLSQGDLRLHFGLGAEKSATVEVRWPSSDASDARRVEANQSVTIRQGVP